MIAAWAPWAAALFFVAGMELSTRAVSVALVRLREGIRDLRIDGSTVHVPTEQFWLGGAFLALAAATLAVHLLRSVSSHVLTTGGCPSCGQDTKRIRRTPVQRLLAPVLGSEISRRRCGNCGWVGLVKDY